jgi:hypothetical protein
MKFQETAPDKYSVLTDSDADADPEGPKIYRSYGSG